MIDEKYLIDKFIENKWKTIEVICPDKAKLYITPCGYDEINSISDIEYFMIDGDLPWLGANSITEAVNQINNHAQLVEESDQEKKKLRDLYEEYSSQGWPEDTWSFYSDYHKDVYGFRPSRNEEPGIYVNPSER